MHRNFGRRPAGASAVLALGVAAIGLLSGCSDLRMYADQTKEAMYPAKRIDLVAAGTVKAQALSGPALDVSAPTVFSQKNVVSIAGTVTRRPGANDAIDGFLDLRVVAADGSLVNEELLHWAPEFVPTTGTRSAKYSANFLGVPPAGATVRVSYVQNYSDLAEAEGQDNGGGTAADHAGGGSSRSYGGAAASFGGNFGRH